MANQMIGRLAAAASKLTRSQKVLAVVAVVLVAMFVTTSATSGRNSAAPADPRQHDLVQWLGGMFGSSAEVADADLTAGCAAPVVTEAAPSASPAPAPAASAAASPAAGQTEPASPDPAADSRRQIAVRKSCVLHIAPADDDVRTVTLTSKDYPVRVRARAPHDSSEVDADVAAGATIEVAVDSEGVDITVTCSGVDSCVLAIGKAA